MIRRSETTDADGERQGVHLSPISKPNNNSTALLHLILSSIQLTINQQQSTQTKALRPCTSQHWTPPPPHGTHRTTDAQRTATTEPTLITREAKKRALDA